MRHQFKAPTIQNNQWVIKEEEPEQQNVKNILTHTSYAEDYPLDGNEKILLQEELKQPKFENNSIKHQAKN